MAKKTRLGIFKVIATCTHCGNPVIVNGPLTNPVCSSCLKEIEIPPETWVDIIGCYLEDFNELSPGDGSNSTLMAGNLTLKYSYIKLPPPAPACLKCETNWELESIQNGTDGNMVCRNCGYPTPVFPAPAWLKAVLPSASQVFFAERETGSTEGGTPVDSDLSATRPIALSCPQCGGGLLITALSERTLPCKYCNVDVYLPDGVWLKLHPAKVAKYWMIRFEEPFTQEE
jgi:uncharacterized protein (DUF983 family)